MKPEKVINKLLDDAINQKKEVTLRGSGICMDPLIKAGDGISFRRVDISELKWLDIIEFKIQKTYTTHRFIRTIRKNGRAYIISRIDNSGTYDDPIEEKDFAGKVTKIKKSNRTIHLNSLRGKLESYANIFISPLCSLKENKKYFEGEDRLLILLSEMDMDNRGLAESNKLASCCLNWSYIVEKMKCNFIVTLALNNLINSGLRTQIAPELEKELRQASVWQLYNDTKIYSELKNVLSAFRRNEVKVMLIKGAHLGKEIYGDTFFRWMGDIDILARVNDWQKIRNILNELGFTVREGDYETWGLQYLDNHITFFKKNIRLEVKFNIWQMDFPSFEDDLRPRARNIALAGIEVLAPSIEDTLLIACVNLTRHNYSGLIWMCDIREIISRFKNKIDWDIIINRAKEKDIGCMVYYALYYSSKLLEYKLPEGILLRLKPPFAKILLHKFFWSENIILWKKEGCPQRANIPFEISTLLFGGKINFKPKKLFKMLRYIVNVIIHGKGPLARRCKTGRNSPKLIFCYLLQPLRVALMILNGIIALVLGRK